MGMKLYHKYGEAFHEIEFEEKDILVRDGKTYSLHWDENSTGDEPDDEFPTKENYVVCPICKSSVVIRSTIL